MEILELARRNALEKLFKAQITTLNDRGCPAEIIDLLGLLAVDVVHTAADMTFAERRLPFLPVIPRPRVVLSDQMAMVRYQNRIGQCYPHHEEITDSVDTPLSCYYIFDVEDGRASQGVSVHEANKLFKTQYRSPLTVTEAIALCTHTEVLSQYCLWPLGSHGVSKSWLPALFLGHERDHGRRPWLGRALNYKNVDKAAPSCGSRLSF
jgi:hypothetical protein